MQSSALRRIGFIVNPVAGIGGAVGLKGSDGDLAARAQLLGATPIAPARAARALASLAPLRGSLEILTASGEMGENVARAAGFLPRIVHRVCGDRSTGADTRAAAIACAHAGAELILFVGGDGTARDVLAAIDRSTPALGVPAGVKMHSAVFGTTPRAAGEAALALLEASDPATLLHDAEVMDRETNATSPSPHLYGYLRTPRSARLVQFAKATPRSSDAAELEGACRRAAEYARDDRLTFIGPGSTMQRVKQFLGFEGALLGVDVVCAGKLIARDASEQVLLDLLNERSARIFVSIVGGQGFLFGRGNQQFSPRVIRRVGPEQIVIVASLEKVSTLPAGGMLVDTGDESLDRELAGYRHVIVGPSHQTVCRVIPA